MPQSWGPEVTPRWSTPRSPTAPTSARPSALGVVLGRSSSTSRVRVAHRGKTCRRRSAHAQPNLDVHWKLPPPQSTVRHKGAAPLSCSCFRRNRSSRNGGQLSDAGVFSSLMSLVPALAAEREDVRINYRGRVG